LRALDVSTSPILSLEEHLRLPTLLCLRRAMSTLSTVIKQHKRIFGPLLDNIAIQVEVPRVELVRPS
jgi:hypothetical protein